MITPTKLFNMEELDPSPEYIKAFNNGYNLRKHEPEIFKQTIRTQNAKGEKLKAMNDGAKQFEFEQFKEQNNAKNIRGRER